MMSFSHRLGTGRLAAAVLVLSALALSACAVVGCERGSANTLEDESAAAGASGAAADSTASCETVEDCDGYLSCLDSTCQEPPAVTGRHTADTPVVTFVDGSGEKVASFFVELALTAAEQRKGLMYRREMQDDWGMLFIYPDEAPRSFWMQNTFLSLDMIFIDGEGRILNILEEVEPLTRTRRQSQGAARYVLELEAGRAREAGLEPGQRMQLENVDEPHRPRP